MGNWKELEVLKLMNNIPFLVIYLIINICYFKIKLGAIIRFSTYSK
jgi:hypothetical protein